MTNEELKVGMILRTKKGTLHNIDEISSSTNRPIEYHYDSEEDIKNNNIGWKEPIELDNISKVSYNLIDLIEAGDYVNGRLVISASDVYTTDNIYIGKEIFIEPQDLIIEEDIKIIVTKEQMEAIQYAVK